MCRLIHFSSLRRQVQTHKSFSGAWHTRDKTNDLALMTLRFIHEFFNTPGRDVQILCPSVETRDGFDRMLSIKRACSFNNRGRRMIWGEAKTARRAVPLLPFAKRDQGSYGNWQDGHESVCRPCLRPAQFNWRRHSLRPWR